jgi:methylase of polypeptide subunit release factors
MILAERRHFRARCRQQPFGENPVEGRIGGVDVWNDHSRPVAQAAVGDPSFGDRGMSAKTAALLGLLTALDAAGYDFITPTPSVSRRGLERRLSQHSRLRAIFGWSQPFAPCDLDPALLALAEEAQVLVQEGDLYRCQVRVSRLAGLLFLHSAFPANASDAVFLGPDSYRFARLIAQATSDQAVAAIAEIGCGAGVGGLVASRLHPTARLELGDVNLAALELAHVNATHADVAAQIRKSDGMTALNGPYDLIVANPPYVAGVSGRAYKDGGDMHGARLALDWTQQAMERLSPGGRFVLYTGSAILDGGVDALRQALEDRVSAASLRMRYEELDPDIFSGELRREAYADVERIAAVGAVIERPV